MSGTARFQRIEQMMIRMLNSGRETEGDTGGYRYEQREGEDRPVHLNLMESRDRRNS